MKILKLFVLFIVLFPKIAIGSVRVSTSGNPNRYSKLKNVVLCKGKEKDLLRFAKIVFDDLDFTDQFDVEIKKTNTALKDIKLANLFKKNVSLITFLSAKVSKNNMNVKAVVKDTNSGSTFFEKELAIKRDCRSVVTSGHKLSSDILEALTGDRGVCLSSIVYCKMVSPKHKVICLSDYTCKSKRVIVGAKTVNLAPRWHSRFPVLFYSQLTKDNNRLMSIDLRDMSKKVACSYPGLNMQPSFSKDGKRSILCLSGGEGNADLYLYDVNVCSKIGRKVFKRLTNNGAHNVTPSILPNGDVIFCSDYRTGSPQIHYLFVKTGRIIRLTNGRGYAAAPTYCEKTNEVAYVRPVRGTFQVFTISLDNLRNVQEKQVTFGAGSKHEPCWSYDGRYLIFSMEKKHKSGKVFSQIAALNYKSKKIRLLTSGGSNKTFPRWTNKTLF